jgi:hypothetical protein
MSTDQVDPLSPFHTEALRWWTEETTSKHKRTLTEVLNTQSRTAVKGRSSSLEYSRSLENSQHERTRFFRNVTQDLRLEGYFWWLIWMNKQCRNNSGSGLENRDYGCGDPMR